MSQNFPTDAGVLITPGAYARYNVVSQNNGVATTGIVMLVGEADAGPDFSLEGNDLASNIYGPGQIGDVRAKYVSGRLVDAFNAGAVPANDPQIQGAPAGFILVKTNPSTKATANLVKFDDSTYSALQDRSFGKLGNLISFQTVAKTEEVVPTTGPFAFMLAIASTNIDVRVNGGAAQPLTIAALETPTAFVSALTGLTGLTATGGDDLAVMTTTTGTLALTVVAGNKVRINRSVAFEALPPVGSTLFIPDSTPLSSIETNNAGSYIVTGSSSTEILATKLLDTSGSPAAITPPTNQAAIAIVAATDVTCYGAVTVSTTAMSNPIDGFGKSLQIDELTSGTGVLSALCYTNGVSAPTKSTWVSKTASPKLISSATEYSVSLIESRQVDNITNTVNAGGAIALRLGYVGTTSTAVVDATTITITSVGGDSPGTVVRDLADFPTIADLAANLNSLPGYTATPGTAVIGSSPSTSLDQGTFSIASTFSGLTPGRIKQDAYKFYTTLQNNGFLTQLPARAASGLPAPTAGVSFLSGGAKGATTDEIFAAALDALKLVRGNFLVPLVSRDAADDIADGLTDASSSYTIEAVNANALAHCLQMSTLKKRRNRQAFLSFRGTLEAAKAMSGELSSFRASLAFQDVRDKSAGTGAIAQFQPWMNAVKAAGMQAAGFYRAIFNKGIAISGALQAAGDFNDQDDDAVDLALEAGLLIVARPPTGGFRYVSDQTTYGRDNNFVYNSIQAVYVADIISLTTAQVMEQMFVGQSLADITAAQALSVLDSIMENLKRLKLIAFSDDAPKGYKNPIIKISGPAMLVSAEVKAATALYFIPITFSITQIQQSA